MKAIVLNIHDMFGRRYKMVILANNDDDLAQIWDKYPYTEVESVDYVQYVMDKNYKQIHEDVEEFIKDRTFNHLNAIVLNVHDIFDKRYKMVILATDEDNLTQIWQQYPYTEVESKDYVDYVLDKNTYYRI